MNEGKRYKKILLWVPVFLVLVPVLNVFHPIAFFFEGSLSQQQGWFPRLYVGSAVFFNGLYPAAYGMLLYALLRFRYALKPLWAIVGAVVTGAWVWLLQHRGGFMAVAVYLLPVGLCLVAMVYNHTFPQGLYRRMGKGRLARLAMGSVLFFSYLFLSLRMERFHPFAEYTMFNRFPSVTTVFFLTDTRGNLIPLQKYCRENGNFLYELYVAINTKHHFSYGENTEVPEEQEVVYDEMMDLILADLKLPLPSDSVRLNKMRFYVSDEKWIREEEPLKSYRVQ